MNTPETRPLGRSGLQVPRLGVGAMTWGDPSGLARFTPAKLSYGGPRTREDEDQAFRASLQAGATFFDTAAMYSRGASERRLGELARGTPAIVATKFPPGMLSRTEDLPQALGTSLARLQRDSIDLYQHHFPSRRVDIPRLMDLMADAVEAGKVRAVGVSNYSAAADAHRPRGAGRARHPAGLQPGPVLAPASPARDRRRARRLPRARRDADRLHAAGERRADAASTRSAQRPSGLRRFTRHFRGASLEALATRRRAPAGDRRTPRQDARPGRAALAARATSTCCPSPAPRTAAQAAENAGALTFTLTRR